MALLLNQTLPLETGEFLHHVIKRGLFDLKYDNSNDHSARQFVVMQEDEANSDNR
jgi:hypothetical protein